MTELQENVTEQPQTSVTSGPAESRYSSAGLSWTDERIAYLMRRFEEGASGSVIAAEVGSTRNAVLGKIHRLRKDGRLAAPVAKPCKARIVDVRPRYKQPRPFKSPHHDVLPDPLAPAEPAISVVPNVPGKNLLELHAGDCRFPSGHPGSSDFFFCGAPKQWGSAYCRHHHRITHQLMPTTRKDLRRTGT